MIIRSSNVSMNSQNRKSSLVKSTAKVTTLVSNNKNFLSIIKSPADLKYCKSLGIEARASQQQVSENQYLDYISEYEAAKSSQVNSNNNQKAIKSLLELRLHLLEKILSIGLGKKFYMSSSAYETLQNMQNQGNGSGEINVSYSKEIVEITMEKHQSEKVEFNSSVAVKTADGKEINVEIGFSMSKEISEKVSFVGISEKLQVLVDPLIINFDNNTAELSDVKFDFDLDCDREKDQISSLKKGSGFLAFDKDNNGIIDNGNELFGVKSGNGFKDLAEYDDDNNGWIDESDDIFNKLRIWVKNSDGSDKLLALGEVGIGAIHLGYAQTSMGLHNNDNSELNGALRNSGVFLFENGTAGTIQHIDFAI